MASEPPPARECSRESWLPRFAGEATYPGGLWGNELQKEDDLGGPNLY